MRRFMTGTAERACTVTGGGFLSVFIGFFCPLCVPSSAAVFSAIGLAFIPQKQVIFPLIAVFAAVLLYGLIKGLRRHGDVSPLLFGTLGIVAVVVGRYFEGSAFLTYGGAFSTLAASIWNFLLPARQDSIMPFDPKAMDKLLAKTSA